MPYRVRKIETADLNERKAIGVSLPFTGNSVFNSTYQTVDAYKANLLTYFLTDRGSRYLNPLYGNILRKFVFQQTLTESDRNEMEDIIREDISLYFPKLVLDEILIENVNDEHVLEISLSFHIRDTESAGDLTIQFV